MIVVDFPMKVFIGYQALILAVAVIYFILSSKSIYGYSSQEISSEAARRVTMQDSVYRNQ